MGKRVWIDCGHGGYDSGATGNGRKESDNVLQAGLKLKYKLEALGFTVGMTRTTDVFVGLNERCTMANNWGADVFISIHNNSADDPQAHGLETYALAEQYNGLACKVHSALINSGAHTRDRGVKYSNFRVLKGTVAPACLVELGFISNSEDAGIILNRMDTHVDSMAKGICDYFGIAFSANEDTTKYCIKTGWFNGKAMAEKQAQMLRDTYGWYVDVELY